MKDDGKEKPGVLIYFDIREPLAELEMDERGELFTAMLDYAADGVEPSFDNKVLRIAWAIVKRGIDKDDEAYRTTVIRRTYAVYCREEKKAERTPLTFDEWHHMISSDITGDQVISHDIARYPTTTTTTTPTTTTTTTTTINNKGSAPPAPPADPPKGKRFVKPTLEEVAAYIREKGYAVDPERFYSYYESCGWQVKGRSMRDWKAAVSYWNTRDRQTAASSPPAPAPQRKGNYFQQSASTRSMSWEEWEANGIEAGEEDT